MARIKQANTHPAIIDEQTFEAVQKIREHKRRPIKTDKVSLFSGKVFYADCGAKLYYCTTHYFDESRDFFACSQYRSNTGSIGDSCYGAKERKGGRIFELCESEPQKIETYYVRVAEI